MRPTIKEMRERSAYELAQRITSHPTDAEVWEAKKLMNAYYRLCSLDYRICILENTESMCNLTSTHRLVVERERKFNDLNERFNVYNAELQYFGIYPTICQKGTTQDLYLAHFYG